MAINIKFDLSGNPELPTIILAKRSGKKLGQLNVDYESIDLKDKLVDASEFSFTLNKYIDDKINNLWDKVVDFKLVYCKEWDMWFEIKVELDEATETIKTVFCTQLGHAELSQINLYNVEINTEEDIARDDYKITILYNPENSKGSLLDRLLEKAPHYTIAHVDSTIANIQRSFSFDGTSICDAFQEISEEIGCLFVINSNSNENGKPSRTISVYDLEQNCKSCGHRGEYTDVCPKCGSTNIKYGYGEDTKIFVTSDELASSGIQLTTDSESVKNCFKLEAGDDLMTATIRNCNPNGTDYIWKFSDETKEDMSTELVEKLESYDKLYAQYYNDSVSNINSNLLSKYNALVDKYSVYNEDLAKITNPIIGYVPLMTAYYNVIDFTLFLESSLMPSVKIDDTDAREQAALLTTSYLSPVAVSDIDIASLATVNSIVLSMAKIVVDSTYKVEINGTPTLSGSGATRTWKGSFVVTNYSDEEDTAISSTISVVVNDNLKTYIEQKLNKALNKENTDDYSVSGLFEKEYDSFCKELKKYALNPLNGFYEACLSCIDILIEQGVGNTGHDLYKSLYTPYYNKLKAIESEIKIRENELNILKDTYNKDGSVKSTGLKSNIEKCITNIQDALDFEKYLGKELSLEFSSYRREDKYSNSNYISDGLNNAELFEKALEFIEVANNEIYKASEWQYSISTTLNNLLSIPKFESFVEHFNVGNWIRVQVDDDIYKLRLLEYGIDYGDFNNISVEFSNVTKIRDGITDVENILSKASSMASSYDSLQRQASKGNEAKNTIRQWLADGLDASLVRIQNNINEDITIDNNGILGRSYNDTTEQYSPEQIRITHNIIAYTDDDWKTVRQAIGKHDYKLYDEGVNAFVDRVGYGMSADFVTAGVVSGSQIIGGNIYSDNYSITGRTGSYLNLRDGTFSFGGGSMRYENGTLYLSSPDIPSRAEITEISETYIKTTTVYAEGLKVGSANIQGQLTASQINTTGLIAENIYGTNIDGKIITGGSINIGNGNFVVDSNGNMTANSGTFEGTINSSTINSGTMSGTTIKGGTITGSTIRAGKNYDTNSDSSYMLYATDDVLYLGEFKVEEYGGRWIIESQDEFTGMSPATGDDDQLSFWASYNDGDDYGLVVLQNGSVKMKRASVKELFTANGGIKVNGDLTVTGNIISSGGTGGGIDEDETYRFQDLVLQDLVDEPNYGEEWGSVSYNIIELWDKVAGIIDRLDYIEENYD